MGICVCLCMCVCFNDLFFDGGLERILRWMVHMLFMPHAYFILGQQGGAGRAFDGVALRRDVRWLGEHSQFLRYALQ